MSIMDEMNPESNNTQDHADLFGDLESVNRKYKSMLDALRDEPSDCSLSNAEYGPTSDSESSDRMQSTDKLQSSDKMQSSYIVPSSDREQALSNTEASIKQEVDVQSASKGEISNKQAGSPSKTAMNSGQVGGAPSITEIRQMFESAAQKQQKKQGNAKYPMYNQPYKSKTTSIPNLSHPLNITCSTKKNAPTLTRSVVTPSLKRPSMDSPIYQLPPPFKTGFAHSENALLPSPRRSFQNQRPLPEENDMIQQLKEKEAKLLEIAQFNASKKGKDQAMLFEMRNKMGDKMNELKASLENALVVAEATMRGEMESVHSRVRIKDGNIKRLLSQYKCIRLDIERNIHNPPTLRRKSIDLMKKKIPNDEDMINSLKMKETQFGFIVNSTLNHFNQHINNVIKVAMSGSATKSRTVELSTEMRDLFHADSLPISQDIDATTKELFEHISDASSEQVQSSQVLMSERLPTETKQRGVRKSNRKSIDRTKTRKKSKKSSRSESRDISGEEIQSVQVRRVHNPRPVPKRIQKIAKKNPARTVPKDSKESFDFLTPAINQEVPRGQRTREIPVESKLKPKQPETSWPPPKETEADKALKKKKKGTAKEKGGNWNAVCFNQRGSVHFCRLKVDSMMESHPKWTKAPRSMGSERPYPKMNGVKYSSTVYNSNEKAIYRFGGVMDGQQLNRAEKYSLKDNQWTELPKCPIPRQDALSLMLNKDTIITMGGAASLHRHKKNHPVMQAPRTWKFYDDISLYQIGRGQWKRYDSFMKKLKMSSPRYSFAGLSMGYDQVVVFGGNRAKGRMDNVEMFDLQHNKWSHLKAMPCPKTKHAAAWYNDSPMIAGGDDKSNSTQCFKFDFVKNQWFSLPSLNQKRVRPVLQENKDKSCVIAAGDSFKLHSFELLDERVDERNWMLTECKGHPMNVEYKAGMIVFAK